MRMSSVLLRRFLVKKGDDGNGWRATAGARRPKQGIDTQLLGDYHPAGIRPGCGGRPLLSVVVTFV